MAGTEKPVRAAVLVRISDDRAGDAAGVARQEADARALADRLGWTVGEVVAENDVSAFKRRVVSLPDGTRGRRVVRPAFRRLLAMLQIGESDGLIAYDLDRVARDPRDLEDLIDVVERTRVPVESVSGSLRLSSDADVTMARIMCAVANKESRDKSRRISRKMREIAEQGGHSGGPRRFGFESDGVTHRKAEVAAIRWAARQILAGAEIQATVRGLDRRCPPVKGGVWWDTSLLAFLRNPRTAGLRCYKGEILGPAVWKPILDRETWDAVNAALAARPRAGNVQQLVHWLNGVLICSSCGRKLRPGRPGKNRRQYYVCNTVLGGCGRIAVLATLAEAEVERRVLDQLAHTDRLRGAASTDGVDLEAGERGLAADRDQLKSVARLWADRHITLAEYTEARAVIERRVSDVCAGLAAARADRAQALIGPGEPRQGWDALDPHGKREVILAVIGRLLVRPADLTRRGTFQPERLEALSEEP
jgi:site-specific DNA recombinase